MKAYIGTKVIRAEPMDECSFLREVKGEDVTNRETRPGYLVRYSNPNGKTYDSWSPSEVFEAAYREVSEGEKELINL